MNCDAVLYVKVRKGLYECVGKIVEKSDSTDEERQHFLIGLLERGMKEEREMTQIVWNYFLKYN